GNFSSSPITASWRCLKPCPASGPTATTRTRRCCWRGAPEMELTHGQLRDFIRSIHERPNGTGALLNLVRASEVRAAAELTCLADVILDDELRLHLTPPPPHPPRPPPPLLPRIADIR